MNSIKVLDKEFVPYLSEKEIQEKITALAVQLNKDYAGKKPIFLSILNGSFLFAAELMKSVSIDCEITFFVSSSKTKRASFFVF